MNYSVADAIASMGGDATTGRTADISAILPYGIAPGSKVVMRREKAAAEQVTLGLRCSFSVNLPSCCSSAGRFVSSLSFRRSSPSAPVAPRAGLWLWFESELCKVCPPVAYGILWLMSSAHDIIAVTAPLPTLRSTTNCRGHTAATIAQGEVYEGKRKLISLLRGLRCSRAKRGRAGA